MGKRGGKYSSTREHMGLSIDIPLVFRLKFSNENSEEPLNKNHALLNPELRRTLASFPTTDSPFLQLLFLLRKSTCPPGQSIARSLGTLG